jgi:hypothetical protein
MLIEHEMLGLPARLKHTVIPLEYLIECPMQLHCLSELNIGNQSMDDGCGVGVDCAILVGTMPTMSGT